MHENLFSIVIPVIPKHFKYIPTLLSELNQESILIGEVLICASSVTDASRRNLEVMVENYSNSLSVRIFSTTESRTAGENRNIGWGKANFEFISFLDADDIYHPNRLNLISRIIDENKIDALVHDYFRLAPRSLFSMSKIFQFKVVNTASLLAANIVRLKTILPPGEIYSGESNLELPDTLKISSRVHHGHLVVRRTIPLRYSSRRFGEDGELVVDLLKSNYNLVYINVKLSIYDRLNFPNIKQSIFGHTKVSLSRIYRFLVKFGKSN